MPRKPQQLNADTADATHAPALVTDADTADVTLELPTPKHHTTETYNKLVSSCFHLWYFCAFGGCRLQDIIAPMGEIPERQRQVVVRR